jgi:GT2 family glycosyltransferase
VVDNGSSEKFHLENRRYPFPIELIQLDKNLGFAGGNEVGMKKARGKYLFLINNDTEVPTDFLSPMIRAFEDRPSLGMLSPLLRFFDTRRIQYAGSTHLNAWTLRNQSRGFNEVNSLPYKGFEPTGFIHGAAMMIPKAVYEEVGGMWEPFFLYYEEYDWCARIRNAGYTIGFLGDVEILHKESASVGRMSPLKIRYMVRNRLLFARRNSGSRIVFTAPYLIIVVGLRDSITYLLTGQRHLLAPMWKGIKEGILVSKL